MRSLLCRLGPWTALYRKELSAYFDAPTAYVITVVMLIISGYFFATPLFLQNQATLSGFVSIAPLLFLFFIPALTMRLYSEELKSGTIEIITTLPVTDEETLSAKFCAAMTLVSFMLAGTAVFPATLLTLGTPNAGGICGAYLGLWLTSLVFTAIGLWTSSLTRNQVIAFILAFLVNLVLFLAGQLHDFMPEALMPLTDFLGFEFHLDRLSRGVLDSRDFLYYFSLSGYFLYLTYLRTQARRLGG